MALRARISKQSILVVLMLLSVVSILLGPAAGQALRERTMWILPPAEAGTVVAKWGNDKVNDLTADNISQAEARRLKVQNEALQSKVDALAAQLTDRQEQLRKVQQLRNLSFGPIEDIPCELIPARVVAGDSQVYGQTRVVNVRSARKGLAVTTDRSKALAPNRLSAIALPPNLEALSSSVLVGRLVESGAFSARMQMVTDRDFNIRARIQRKIDPNHADQSRRVLTDANIGLINVNAVGDGKDSLTVTSVKESDHVLPGDWLVTCSDDPLLPAQIHVGEVVEVKPDPRRGGFVNLKIKPSADTDTLREVFVVVPRGKDALDKN
jgi:cell shape-determining protein MreC